MHANDADARRLLEHRRVLFAYLYAIVRDHDLAEDLFQEVSMVILRRGEEEGELKNFWAFAREVARRQALAALRQSKRSPIILSAEALDAIDRGFEPLAGEFQARHEALRHCLKVLPSLWEQIVRLRYWMEFSVADVARKLARSENTISVTLNRIRSKLADCVRQRLRAQEPG